MHKKSPVTVRGVTYASQADAGRALCVNPSAIAVAKAENRLETVGLTQTKPIEINGKRFESRNKAAKAFGVTVQTVRRAAITGTISELADTKRTVKPVTLPKLPFDI